ncbi:hypothetical protein FHT44_000678 [Mycolicibacterium sp. BK634]|uniref:hypothetical protein n=1 Tax=Mycolicibacterium sp. BK634 TaxID=2587099 RepID=UPI0016132C4E|nr:hypothetical protein [Mycolicibacterium sp. BK634]MBB3748217.1 hypothetical protein [Mycolicibacterium sp. BK634]
MSQGPYGPAPSGPPQWPAPSASRGSSKLPTILAIVIAVIAVAVAIGAWFRPAPKPETQAPKAYSDQEVSDAKKAVCDAFGKAFDALTENSRQPDNPTEALAVIANSRIAIHAAGTFLTAVLAEQPAAPDEITIPVRALANQYQSMILDQIGNADRATLDGDYRNAESLTSKISQVCK